MPSHHVPPLMASCLSLQHTSVSSARDAAWVFSPLLFTLPDPGFRGTSSGRLLGPHLQVQICLTPKSGLLLCTHANPGYVLASPTQKVCAISIASEERLNTTLLSLLLSWSKTFKGSSQTDPDLSIYLISNYHSVSAYWQTTMCQVWTSKQHVKNLGNIIVS